MTQNNIGCKCASRRNILGMDGTVLLKQALNHLLKETADDHIFSILVIGGHKRTNQTVGGHTAATAVFLNQYSSCAVSCRCHRCTETCGAAADNRYVAVHLHRYFKHSVN